MSTQRDRQIATTEILARWAFMMAAVALVIAVSTAVGVAFR